MLVKSKSSQLALFISLLLIFLVIIIGSSNTTGFFLYGFDIQTYSGDNFYFHIDYSNDSFVYSVKNIGNETISNISTSIMLPTGTNITDAGSATANGTILTWTISSLTPDEETSFAFGA
ncbi:MAG: hypothetical protein GOV02_02320, partial [Candidatus Aenigmarchaeota archaeon]|nr:hypothetical protein [Candidatus Aenigmarchaeota archaeon]